MHMVDLTGESFSINDLQCHDEFVMMEKRCIETLLQKVSVWLSTYLYTIELFASLFVTHLPLC
jgi:hypothetical protein